MTLQVFHSRWIAAVTAATSTISPSRIASGGSATWPKEVTRGRSAGGFELDDADRVRPDVQADQAAGHVPPSLPRSAGMGTTARVEELDDVVAPDPQVLADPDCGQLARLDEAIHRHRGHPHDLSNLTGSQEVIRDCRRHAHLSSTDSGTVSLSVNNRQHGQQC